jgi:2-dehydropantoate 2-reductase
MNILVLGAGAMGSYYGARLIQAGASVSFLLRSGRARQVRSEGLRVASELAPFAAPVKVVEAGEATPHADLVLLTCKAYDLPDAVRAITPAVGPDTAILPLLNGLAPYALLDATFGRERVLGGVAYIAVALQDDGSTRQLGSAEKLIVGARTSRFAALATQLSTMLLRSAGQGVASPAIEQALWNKWVMLCAGAAVTCLLRANVGQILATSTGQTVIEAALDECLAVARAEGFALNEEALAGVRGLLLNPASGWMASMARDIAAGSQRLEADAIVGDMLTRSARHGLAAPILSAAYASLQCYLHQAASPAA